MINFSLNPSRDRLLTQLARKKRSTKTAVAKRVVEKWIEAQEDLVLLKIAQKRLRARGKTYSMREVKRALGL